MKKILLILATVMMTMAASADISYLAVNPTSGSLTVRFDDTQSEEIQLTVFNFLGQPVFSSKFMTSEGQNAIRLDNLSLYHGTYMLKIVSRSGEVQILRFNY